MPSFLAFGPWCGGSFTTNSDHHRNPPWTSVILAAIMEPEAIPLVAKQVAKMLVERKFTDLAKVGSGAGLSAEDMKEALDEMDVPLVMPPERVWEELDVAAIAGEPGRFLVVFDLWSARGRSDWSVELTIDGGPARPLIDVESIHVM